MHNQPDWLVFLIGMVAGGLLPMAIALLRHVGKTQVEQAEAKLVAALKTPDAKDDEAAKRALQSAERMKAQLDAFATAIESVRKTTGKGL